MNNIGITVIAADGKFARAALWLLACLIFIGAACLLYRPCWNGSFIWDDHFLVKDNLLIRSPALFAETFRHFLGYDPASNFYRPIQTVSYLSDYWRGGLAPWIYHQTNLVIHGLNGVLLFSFLIICFHRQVQHWRKLWLGAFVLSLWWLVHPIHSATAAYIAGRADSLALLFSLSSWCLWEMSKSAGKPRRRVFGGLMLLTGFFALCSKEAALAGLGLFLLNVFFLEKDLRARSKLLICLTGSLLLGAYLTLRLTIENTADPNTFHTVWPDRPLLVLRALGDYLRLLVFPTNLRMERQVSMVGDLYVNPASFDPLYPFLAWLGIGFLLLLILAFFWRGKFQAARRFGVLWFAVLLAPVSNIFSLNSTVAEHWLYLPSIGLLIVLLAIWLDLNGILQKWAIVGFAIWICGLSMRTNLRAKDWSSPITFFEKTIHDGGDTARMRTNLANEFRLAGRLADGEALLKETLRRSPPYFQAKHALAANLQAQGRLQEANELIGDSPNAFGESFSGRVFEAERLLQTGRLAEAWEPMRKLQEDYPNSWMVTRETIHYLQKIGRGDLAETFLKNFVAGNRWHGPSTMLLAEHCAEIGEIDQALSLYLTAAELDLRNAFPLKRGASLLANKGRDAEAASWQRKADAR